ncbi:MAG: ATP-dependent DNA ligase [Methanobacteriota archaeon]
MDYAEIAKTYEALEGTTKRLEMTQILVDLLKATRKEDVRKVVYLTRGMVAPDFEGVEFGVADRLAVKAIYEATRVSGLEEVQLQVGDLGEVAKLAVEKKAQRALFSEPLTLDRVFGNLVKIARAEGSGAQDARAKLLAELIHDSTPLEAKYICRTVVGKLRLGIADMTIVDALAAAFATKEQRGDVERAYNLCSDLGLVAEKLASGGIDSLSSVTVSVGVPMRAMLCERLSSIPEILEKLGECAFEYKYDGLRVQAHKSGSEVKLFTRQLENVTTQFPDVAGYISKAVTAAIAIVEGEIVPVEPNTGELLPFQVVSRRRGRVHGVGEAAEDFPVHVFLFDCLMAEGRDMTNEPYPLRRNALIAYMKPTEAATVADQIVTGDEKVAEEFFLKSIAAGCEGVVAKSTAPESVYKAGSRGWLWIKYKTDYRSEMTDTVDLVVVGAFAGRGKRSGVYGALLMGARNQDTGVFETVTKLGTGFNDEMLARLPPMLESVKISKPSKRVNTRMQADFWFEPSVVLEVSGAEITLSPIHTCGLGAVREESGFAIRFPRFTGRFRDDKGPEDATSSAEMMRMYDRQLKKVQG